MILQAIKLGIAISIGIAVGFTLCLTIYAFFKAICKIVSSVPDDDDNEE